MTAGRPNGAVTPAFITWADAGFGAELVRVAPHDDPGPNAGKRPVGDGWPEMEVTRAMIEAWARGRYNAGLRTRHFPVIDVDVDDAEIAAAVATVAVEVLGPAPQRSRNNSARSALLYRLAGAPFRKTKLTFTTPRGERAKVEILADGQQLVVAGIHPTGAELAWDPMPRAESLTAMGEVDRDRYLARLRRVLVDLGCAVDDTERVALPAATPHAAAVPAAAPDLVLSALRAARLHKRQVEPGKHEVTCPWARLHTDALDAGTAFWEPSTDNHGEGGFKCQHAHCERRTIRDLRDFLGLRPPAAPSSRVLTMSELLDRELSRIEKPIPRLATGFPRLDRTLGGGLAVPSLNVIGAGPKSGKSGMCQMIAAVHAARGGAVYYLDLENGATQFVRRLLCRRARLGPSEIAAVLASPDAPVFASREKVERWREAQAWACGLPITARFAPPEDLRAELLRAKELAGGRTLLAVFDSLQKLPGDLSDRRATVDGWVRLLEQLRLELESVFLMVSEIRRGKEGYAPREDAFKETSGIEYGADLAFTLSRMAADEGGDEVSTLRIELARDADEDPRGDVASYRPERPYYGIEEIDPVERPKGKKKPRGPKPTKSEACRDFILAARAAGENDPAVLREKAMAAGYRRTTAFAAVARLELEGRDVRLPNDD